MAHALEYSLVYTDNKYKADGGIKRNCLVVLPGHRKGYPWGAGGEDGDEHGRSVKSTSPPLYHS